MIQATVKNHIRYYEGDIPIILSVPHGGEVSPDDINNRSSGVFDLDDFTLELTEDIMSEFYRQTKKTPYAVIGEISRRKVDLNRHRAVAYEDERAKVIYDEFHHFIQKSKKEVDKKFSKGLYIDIHGQSHPKGYLEFGYLLVNDVLKLDDENLLKYQNKTSIRTLSKFSTEVFLDQLKGPNSLGGLMCSESYDSIPSQKLPYATDENYFEGAYDTIRYGSLKGGNISGIQIEFPYDNIRDTKENRQKCAQSFVKSIIKFMQIHFNIDLKSKPKIKKVVDNFIS
ncbi:MAG: hypothetical protein U9P71_05625 [Campylobacterota bacterium]|nr:hypothetical protein [Campylobacterota bacterium]